MLPSGSLRSRPLCASAGALSASSTPYESSPQGLSASALLHCALARRAACAVPSESVRVTLDDQQLEVRLARWEKLLGLLFNISVRRTDISDAHVVEDAVREAMMSGIKVGLRLPWVYYVARNLRLDEAFIARRSVPGLSFAINDGRRLKRVLVSTPAAAELARELQRS